MVRGLSTGRAILGFGVVLMVCCVSAAWSCNGEEPPCIPDYGFFMEDQTCAGLPAKSTCSDTYCKDSTLACSKTYYVLASASGGSGSEKSPFKNLSDAAKVATSGDCVYVGPGAYTTAQFNGGVNILGAGADRSKVSSAAGAGWALKVEGGSNDARIRGLGLSGSGIGLLINKIDKKLHIEQVRISGASGIGLFASAAKDLLLDRSTVRATKKGNVAKASVAMGIVLSGVSSARLQHVFIEKNQQYGVLASNSVVVVVDSAVTENGSAVDHNSRGVAITCSSVKKCGDLAKSKLHSQLTNVEVRKNYGIGVTLEGVTADLSKVKVSQSKKTGGSAGGWGVQIWSYRSKAFPVKPDEYHNAEIDMSNSTVEKCEGPGVVIEFASATLKDNVISNNQERGIWLQIIRKAFNQKVVLTKNTVENNERIGIGGTASEEVNITGGVVSGTKEGLMLIGPKNVKIGDGIQVLGATIGGVAMASKFTIDTVKLIKNERASVVIDASEGAVTNCVLDRKNSKTDQGILAQNGGKVTKEINNQDAKGNPLSSVKVPGTKVTINPEPFFMPPSATAPQI